MFTVTDARNGRYNEDGTISADVQFSDNAALYLPYTVAAHDPMDYGRQLYADLIAGKYGPVTPFMVTPEMLAEAKAQKHAEINAWRDAQENGRVSCEYNGNRYDADKESKYRLDNVIEAGGLPDGVKWTDADNRDVDLSLDDLKALQKIMVMTMAVQGGKIHERQRQMKEEVDALTDYNAIQNYITGWGFTDGDA
ncbi:DUF4376 domain-containing protein [Salmonella enterica subsp. enterica serovar Litchfield]|nr:DUF4376 domain-containing protein [Salmonella enterica subsp. enterica serovar Litchfield]EDE3206729.1 DUF4376 domain-containing protein [Salmonella enterica subsp. enterica serovar Litchfield]EDN6793967.1 DUF4376 domain-containing protein [Salmonella enterica]EDY4123867.1 DUF4376 domain-containing protein [Salmonella enterica]